MAEVPPGPSALPASTAESIHFPGGGRTVPGEGEERGCGRGDTVKPATGAHQQASDGKGATRANQKHLHSHQPAHFHSQTQQQLNGLISSAEDGLLHGHHHGCVHSHLHHPALRPPDSQRGQSEHCDGSGEAHGRVPENNNSFCDGNSNCQQDPGSCLRHNLSNNGIGGVLGMIRTEQSPRKVAGQEARNKGHGESTQHPCGPDAARDGEAQRAEVELCATSELQIPVADVANLDLNSVPEEEVVDPAIQYVRYESELQMPDIMRLITKDLSEPYSIYTYRYFIHNWPQLCFLAMVQQECVGAIVCKLDMHKKMFRRGYIAMLAVDSKYRRRSIGTNLVKKAIYAMVEGDCDEVVLETEITNKSALKLYENLGFVRDKRLFRYYLNGVDALRLKLWLR